MSGKKVTVVGAGIVGVCCALWIQRSGHDVTLVDKNAPGSGTSSGNACTIADYACVPVNNPGLLKALPRLMFAKDSPLSVDFSYALRHLPWMWQFLRQCRRSKVDHTITQLGTLLRQTAAGLDPLVFDSKAERLFATQGCLYVYQTEVAFKAAAADNEKRRQQGVEFEVLNTAQIREREPAIKPDFHAGLLFSNARHTLNPQTLATHFFDHFIASGGHFVQQEVRSIESIRADHIVIAAGAFSNLIAGSGAERLPLETERGYHVQYAGKQSMLGCPVGWAEAGFYATPMDQGLRIAGTVEIAGIDKAPNKVKIDYLKKYAQKMFDLEQSPDQTWLGFRPTMPDALPVIGASKRNKNILYAFGHQHIGLTLAGITGKMIAEQIDGHPTSVDIEAFSPDRFG